MKEPILLKHLSLEILSRKKGDILIDGILLYMRKQSPIESTHAWLKIISVTLQIFFTSLQHCPVKVSNINDSSFDNDQLHDHKCDHIHNDDAYGPLLCHTTPYFLNSSQPSIKLKLPEHKRMQILSHVIWLNFHFIPWKFEIWTSPNNTSHTSILQWLIKWK